MEHVPQAAGEDGMPRVDDAGLIADMRWLGKIATRIVKDPGLAEDACQDAWLRATQKKGVVSFRTELSRGVRRFLYRYWRGEQRRTSREQEVALRESQPSVDELLGQHEQQKRLWSALLELDEPYRSTLILRFQAGLSTGLIAARFGTSEDTIRWRVRQGTDLLRRRFAADEEGGGLCALAAAMPLGTRRASKAATQSVVVARWLPFFPQLLGVLLMLKSAAVICTALVVVLAIVMFGGEGMFDDLAAPPALGAPEYLPGELPIPLAKLPGLENSRVVVEPREPVSEEGVISPDEAVEEALDPPILRLHLALSSGARLPESFTVTVSPYFSALGIMGYPVETSFGITDGSVVIPLVSSKPMDSIIFGSVDPPTQGIVIVTAEGLGCQKSGVVDISWKDGDETYVTMPLYPVTTLEVVAVHEGSAALVKNVMFRIHGPGSKYGTEYESQEGGAVSLSLATEGEGEDRVYVRGDGVALAGWTRRELLAIPRQSGGLRELKLSAGCTLRGSIEMESTLPIPSEAEVRYIAMRHDALGGLEHYPHGVVPEGSVPIAADGRFEISNIPSGALLVHLREKGRFIFETQRLSPDLHVDVPEIEELEIRVVVPARNWVFTINMPRNKDSPWQSNTLVRATLNRQAGEMDAPYVNSSGVREHLAQAGLFRLGDDAQMILPIGTIEEGETYLLSVGANATYELERPITFEGLAPCLDYTIPETARDELGLRLGRSKVETESGQARQMAARNIGRQVILNAQTGLIRPPQSAVDSARNSGELAREILERN
ncbi:MAG: RNA polymerase sigma factor (sigma-70 family) [Planctomycetota bacterium]|jgi:RNA polymerase sigma factor (sigma-70 family)